MELRGGSGSHEGNIFLDGRPVCDDGFSGDENGNENALVVCRSDWEIFDKMVNPLVGLLNLWQD